MAFEDKKDNSPINSCKGYNSALFFPSEFEADSDSEAFIPINKESDSNLNTLTNSPATFNIHKSNILKNNTVNNLKDNRRFSTPLIGNQVFQNFNQNQNSKKKPILPIIEKIEKKDKYKKRSSYTEGINQNIANTLYNFNKIYNNQLHQIYYPSNKINSYFCWSSNSNSYTSSCSNSNANAYSKSNAYAFTKRNNNEYYDNK
jgi:hypothetical protein